MAQVKSEGGPVFDEVFAGTAAIPAATPTQLPTRSASLIRIKASGDITFGYSASQTFPLASGEDSGLIPLNNLNLLWVVSAGGCNVNFIIFR